MAKTKQKNQEAEQVADNSAKPKTPEQIAAEIAGNSAKPIIAAVVVFVIVGIGLIVMNSQTAAKNEESAKGYEALDAVTLENMGKPTYMITTPKPAELDKKIGKVKALQDSPVDSNAKTDALFFEAKFEFEKKNYSEAAKKFKQFYTENGDRQPLADFARLNAVNSYINAGTSTDITEALKIAEAGGAESKDIADKLQYQAALCNILLGGEDKIKAAKDILEKLKQPKADGSKDSISGSAENLLDLLSRTNADDLKTLTTSFPGSLIKVEAEDSKEKAVK